MSETWIIPEKFIHSENSTEGSFFVPGNSLWFSGHFPGMPTLPAIGMLGMVYDTLSEYSAHHGIRLTIREMKRIRFRQILRPESHFSVFISLKTGEEFAEGVFQCTSNDVKVCDGMLVVKVESIS
jgi:3-hydroxymyristoyl/3-hydroxydecanoyl-(acyl carrier protein) dehydratase